MAVEKPELRYVHNQQDFIVIKKVEDDKEIWWKPIPLSGGLGSSFHHGNPPQWRDHFDFYRNGRPTGKPKYIKIDGTGYLFIGSSETRFKKDPSAEVFLCPDPDKMNEGQVPEIETNDLGSVFVVKSNIPIPAVWAATSGGLNLII